MEITDTLIDRNRHFATQQLYKGLSMLPKLKTMIIGCVDPRVDPAQILDLELGEAVVIRNIGGRVTPSAMQTLAMLGRISQATSSNQGPGQGWNIVVLQHTDCGINHLLDAPEMLAGYFGVPKEVLAQKAISDPHAAVKVDVATLKANTALPGGFLVSGAVYHTDTGLIELVVPPAPLR